MHAYIHILLHMRIHIYNNTGMCTYMYMSVYMDAYGNTFPYAYAYIHMQSYAGIAFMYITYTYRIETRTAPCKRFCTLGVHVCTSVCVCV